MIDPEYGQARDEAGRRHNLALLGHPGRASSWGLGIVITCGCGQKYNFDGWRDHLVRICIETPVPARRTE